MRRSKGPSRGGTQLRTCEVVDLSSNERVSSNLSFHYLKVPCLQEHHFRQCTQSGFSNARLRTPNVPARSHNQVAALYEHDPGGLWQSSLAAATHSLMLLRRKEEINDWLCVLLGWHTIFLHSSFFSQSASRKGPASKDSVLMTLCKSSHPLIRHHLRLSSSLRGQVIANMCGVPSPSIVRNEISPSKHWLDRIVIMSRRLSV